MQLITLVAGLAVAFLTLLDALETIVLPRTVRRAFGITRRIYLLTWPPFSAMVRRIRSPALRENLLSYFGPGFLILLVVVWALGLILGFGLIQYSIADRLAAASGRGIWNAIYFSGSTFFTLGLGDVAPVGTAARVVTVAEAGIGFGFLALVVSYLPIYYQAFSRREAHISLLDARAGSPPIGVELLRRNSEDETRSFLVSSELWGSDLLESHLSYPALAHFRSQHENQSWLAALVMTLDTCALIMTGIDGLPASQARFTFAICRHALVDLSQIFASNPQQPSDGRLGPGDFAALDALLQSAGLEFSDGLSAERTLAGIRRSYEPIAEALAERLMILLPPWLPEPNTLDDWESTPWSQIPAIAGER